MELMDAWIASNPDDPGPRIMHAHWARRNFDEARNVYEALQNEGIKDIAILTNLANIYHQLGDPRALPPAKLAFEMAPESARVLDIYGWILSEGGNPKEGLSVLGEAYARESTLPEIRCHLAVALMKLGKNDEALAELEACLARKSELPGREKARALLGELKGDSAVN